MRLSIITSVASIAMALSLSACAGGADLKELNKTIKTLQDDKSCDRVRDIDVGAGGGQLGGEGHASFKEHSECGAGHGAQAIVKPTPLSKVPSQLPALLDPQLSTPGLPTPPT